MQIVDLSRDDLKGASRLTKAMADEGFQATELARAVQVASAMRADKDCLKILAFTANLVASGVRGVIAELIRDGYADLVITSGGAIDHDVIKCFRKYDYASFAADDAALRRKGVNRLGNVMIPNSHYVFFEKFCQKAFAKGKLAKTTPMGVTKLLGSNLPNDKHSFLVAAREKNVPVYSPALVDSSLGLQLHFYKQDHPDFVLDESGDFSYLSTELLSAKRTGAIILGGGPSKHFTLGLNLLRGGLDYGIYLTTAQEYDGSLSGALPKEAKSWGKIKAQARTALVYGDASITLPLLAGSLFHP